MDKKCILKMNKFEEFDVFRGTDARTLKHEPLANTTSTHLISKLKKQQNAALLEMHVFQQSKLIKMERTVVKSILQVTDARVQELVHDQRAYTEQNLDTYSQELQHLKQFTDTLETELGNVTYCQTKVKKSIRALCAGQDKLTAYVPLCRHKMQNDIEKLKQSQSHLMSTIKWKIHFV